MATTGRIGRIVKVTGIISVLGALGGAVGGVVLAIVISLVGGIRGTLFPGDDLLRSIIEFSGFASIFGAAYGVILGPILSWTLMKRVPLWRAVSETALAAALGVGVSMAMPSLGLSIFLFPVFTAVLAALRLRFTHRALPESSVARDTELKS
jgi:hypothetical protein